MLAKALAHRAGEEGDHDKPDTARGASKGPRNGVLGVSDGPVIGPSPCTA